MIEIRPALESDKDQVWQIISEVIRSGDTYVFYPDSSREKMLEYWFANDKKTYVALENERVIGTFFLKDNQMDLGSHIANAGYMVASTARGKGLGKLMGEYSILEAKRLNYLAMQFNIVVKTNLVAVSLWQALGFKIIGEIPEAFQHRVHGLVNAYIMYRKI